MGRSPPTTVSSGGGEDGGKQHIHTGFGSCFYEMLDNFPMPFAENRYIVIIGQTVRVEPLCVQQCLLGQISGDNGQIQRFFCKNGSGCFLAQPQGDRIVSGGRFLFGCYVDPQGKCDVWLRADLPVIAQGQQRIG